MKKHDWINLSSNEPAFGKARKYPYTWPLYHELAKYYNIDENLQEYKKDNILHSQTVISKLNADTLLSTYDFIYIIT